MIETGGQFRGHDHAHCVTDALAQAESLCAARGARLTALRRRVLELVWASHRPRGAYDILEELGDQPGAGGRRAAPLTVYRALEFLVGQGLVHRIESLNRYVGCAEPGASHSGQFLVCDGCGVAFELNDAGITTAISDCAGIRGFRVLRPTVEVHGLCPACQESTP
jgi:Fur family zinc uptake transcriptional regulator